jgi:hypothetical protein
LKGGSGLRSSVAILLVLLFAGSVCADEPEFLSDLRKAYDEAYDRGAPILVIFLRDG